jgi:hypothetical protein
MLSTRRPPARLAFLLAGVLIGALLVPACVVTPPLTESRCHFPGLSLVPGRVCFKVPPTVNPDGSWTWPTSDPKTKKLKKGIIVDFPAGGPLEQIVQFTQSGYLPGTTLKDWIKIYVTGPDGRVVASDPLGYEITCEQPSRSPQSPPVSPIPPTPGVRPATARALAYVYRSAQWTIGGYTFSDPTFSRQPGEFSVRVLATRQLGPADLTFDIRGTLSDFTSRGALRVRDRHLGQSSMGATGLAGRLAAYWSLSAAVPAAVTSRLSLNVSLPLFRWPLLVGDFPVFLAAEIRLHLAPEFSQSARILHGHAEIGFSGSQGLTFDAQSPALGVGGLAHARRGLSFGPGSPFALPKLEFAVTFPYLEIGDDLYDPVAGALVWTGFTLGTVTASGTNPSLCLRIDALVHADVGVTAWLFGLRAGVSRQIYAHPIGSRSRPPSPTCAPA